MGRKWGRPAATIVLFVLKLPASNHRPHLGNGYTAVSGLAPLVRRFPSVRPVRVPKNWEWRAILFEPCVNTCGMDSLPCFFCLFTVSAGRTSLTVRLAIVQCTQHWIWQSQLNMAMVPYLYSTTERNRVSIHTTIHICDYNCCIIRREVCVVCICRLGRVSVACRSPESWRTGWYQINAPLSS